VISAKAGGINAITGQATVRGKTESGWQQLMITDDLNSGDRVRTAFDGRVEILLNPGAYLRVGADSEVELADNTLANLEVRLLKGTAIVEATGIDGVELNINISTPHTKIAIVRHGLYRLSVIPGDATELVVRKGRVVLNDETHTKVKDGNKVVFNQTNTSVAKLTKEEKKHEDDIDAWGKERAETLARANRRITGAMLSAAFASNRDPWGRDPWLSRGFGMWFYNSRFGCYTFVPWYYGWRSPYGTAYTTGTYNPYAGQVSGGSGSSGYRNGGSGNANPPASGGGGSYPSTGGARPIQPPTSSSGGGYSGGMSQPMPSRPIDSDTGHPMPRKSLEPSRPNN
jgi:hypothetical protein